MTAHAYNLRIWEAEAEDCAFEASLGVVTHQPWGVVNECLPTPERKSTAEDTTEVLLDNQYILLGLYTRVWLKSYLGECK